MLLNRLFLIFKVETSTRLNIPNFGQKYGYFSHLIKGISER